MTDNSHAISFPRCLRIRVLSSRFTKALPFCLPKKEAERRKTHLWVPHLAMRRASSSISPICGRERSERARLSAPHRGIPKALTPSARPEPAFPGITGSKREDPLRRQCSEHLAVRSRAGRADAQAAQARSVSLRTREPPPLRLLEYPRERVLRRAG